MLRARFGYASDVLQGLRAADRHDAAEILCAHRLAHDLDDGTTVRALVQASEDEAPAPPPGWLPRWCATYYAPGRSVRPAVSWNHDRHCKRARNMRRAFGRWMALSAAANELARRLWPCPSDGGRLHGCTYCGGTGIDPDAQDKLSEL